MTYSLVGAPTLGYDLARLPHGLQVAHVVRVALRCTPDDLVRLAARHPGPARADRLAEVVAASSPTAMTTALPLAGEALSSSVAGDGSAAGLLSRLESAVMGDVAALDRLIRSDVLDWTWVRSGDLAVQDPHASLAADVLVDAAASAFCSGAVPRQVRREMATPFVGARFADLDDVPTGHEEVDAMLRRVAGADHDVREAWRRAVDEVRPTTTSWAPAMHQATWALTLADRLRLATDAQMAALTAFHAAGFRPRDAAYGVWNALSGVVQATAAADLLPAADHTTLTRVWGRVYG